MRKPATLAEVSDRAVRYMGDLSNDLSVPDEQLISRTLAAIPWRDLVDIGLTAVRADLEAVAPAIKHYRRVADDESKSQVSLDEIPWE